MKTAIKNPLSLQIFSSSGLEWIISENLNSIYTVIYYDWLWYFRTCVVRLLNVCLVLESIKMFLSCIKNNFIINVFNWLDRMDGFSYIKEVSTFKLNLIFSKVSYKDLRGVFQTRNFSRISDFSTFKLNWIFPKLPTLTFNFEVLKLTFFSVNKFLHILPCLHRQDSSAQTTTLFNSHSHTDLAAILNYRVASYL